MVRYLIELGNEDWVEYLYLLGFYRLLEVCFFSVNAQMKAENQLVTAVNLLTDVLKSINPILVPSPKIFDGTNYHTVEDLFL